MLLRTRRCARRTLDGWAGMHRIVCTTSSRLEPSHIFGPFRVIAPIVTVRPQLEGKQPTQYTLRSESASLICIRKLDLKAIRMPGKRRWLRLINPLLFCHNERAFDPEPQGER